MTEVMQFLGSSFQDTAQTLVS